MKTLSLFVLALILSSCYNEEIYLAKSGETVIVGSDTFLVRVDTFRVIDAHRSNPRNVLEEINPQFEHLTDKGKVFFLPYAKGRGDIILTRTLTRIRR